MNKGGVRALAFLLLAGQVNKAVPVNIQGCTHKYIPGKAVHIRCKQSCACEHTGMHTRVRCWRSCAYTLQAKLCLRCKVLTQGCVPWNCVCVHPGVTGLCLRGSHTHTLTHTHKNTHTHRGACIQNSRVGISGKHTAGHTHTHTYQAGIALQNAQGTTQTHTHSRPTSWKQRCMRRRLI